MKVVEFTYTNPDGDVSKRAVVESAKPSKFMSGIDISELDADTMLEFAAKFNAVETQIAELRQTLLNSFDLKHNFRLFDPERMTEVTAEFI